MSKTEPTTLVPKELLELLQRDREDLFRNEPAHGSDVAGFFGAPCDGVAGAFVFPRLLESWRPAAPTGAISHVIAITAGGGVLRVDVARSEASRRDFWSQIQRATDFPSAASSSLDEWIREFISCRELYVHRHLPVMEASLGDAARRRSFQRILRGLVEASVRRAFAALLHCAGEVGGAATQRAVHRSVCATAPHPGSMASALLSDAVAPSTRAFVRQGLNSLPRPVLALAIESPAMRAALTGTGSIADALRSVGVAGPVVASILRRPHEIPGTWGRSRFLDMTRLASAIDPSKLPATVSDWLNFAAMVGAMRRIAGDDARLRRVVGWPYAASPMLAPIRADALLTLHDDFRLAGPGGTPLSQPALSFIVDMASQAPTSSPTRVRQCFREAAAAVLGAAAAGAASLSIPGMTDWGAIDWLLAEVPAQPHRIEHGSVRLVLLASSREIRLHATEADICLQRAYATLGYLARGCVLFRVETIEGRLLGTAAVALPSDPRRGNALISEIRGPGNADLSQRRRTAIWEAIEQRFVADYRSNDWVTYLRRCRKFHRALRRTTEAVIVAGSWMRQLPAAPPSGGARRH